MGKGLVRVDAQQLDKLGHIARASCRDFARELLIGRRRCAAKRMGPSARLRASAPKPSRWLGFLVVSCASRSPLFYESSSVHAVTTADAAEAFLGTQGTHGTRRRTCSWPFDWRDHGGVVGESVA